jgi:hypothetical protein
MRVSQLLESIDYSPLTKIWQGDTLNRVIVNLKTMGEDPALLGDILDNARSKYSESTPEKLFSYVKPLIDATQHHADDRIFTTCVNDLLIHIVVAVLKLEPDALKALKSKVPVELLSKHINQELAVKLKLANWRITRTKDEEQYDEDNQLYVFVGRPTFKEEPKGSDNFKKTLEIERLVPIDRFDQKAHQMVAMMKLRARMQGENSEVYQVHLPKDAFDPDEDVPDYLVDLINQHKKRIPG